MLALQSYKGRRAHGPTPPGFYATVQPQILPQVDTRNARLLEGSQHSMNPSHPSYLRHTDGRQPHPSPSPVPSSSSSGFAQAHPRGQAQDRLQRSWTPDSEMHARQSPYAATSSASQDRQGKRKRPAGADGGTLVPQLNVATAPYRDPAASGPQRSQRRHHNIAEKTHSRILPSGSLIMTFPLDITSPEPDARSSAPAGPPPFEHGPTELPPRPYESNRLRAEGDSSGSERPVRKGRLPADVMDHLPRIEGRLHKIEVSVQEYLNERNKRALAKSELPGRR
ncbi:hypothetical protein BC834DRAFT_896781 [Gloeopeniophorella convolvens]|nr:hypothetical protein BC834DRAFT_896781 [Gloeopeniophorella convolvens]